MVLHLAGFESLKRRYNSLDIVVLRQEVGAKIAASHFGGVLHSVDDSFASCSENAMIRRSKEGGVKDERPVLVLRIDEADPLTYIPMSHEVNLVVSDEVVRST